MKEMLKKNRWQLALSSLVILLPILSAALLGRTAFLWQPPLLLLTQWLVVLAVFWANRDKGQSPKALGLVIWILPALSLLLGILYQLVLKVSDSAALITSLVTFFLGLMFLLIGNYMPKMKQNGAMGIRVKWTLESEENWNATHRYAGRLWFAGGLALMAASLIPSVGVVLALWLVLLTLMVALPTRYSYRFYKGHVAAGKAEKSPVKARSVVLIAALVLAFCGFMAWSLFSGDIQYVLGEDALTVDATGWGDLTIPYGEISSLEYFPEDPSREAAGLRTNGLGNFKVSLGSFENELYGGYTRYTFASCEACLVLETKGGTVVLNGPDPAATQALWEELESRLSR